MKRNRKGFSLVELIVVLVIMAIIAALCAPNISAYVQAAKVQNYQTVANNLADELQTQLPQSRYWNWDEVQRNAYGILCADAGRCVTLDTEKSTDNQKVYQITGASSDANAVFTVSLTYHDAVKTSQKVDIAVSCDGYAAVQLVQECNLVLKTNYTDASAYPMSSTTIATTDIQKPKAGGIWTIESIPNRTGKNGEKHIPRMTLQKMQLGVAGGHRTPRSSI